jgi:hypothetical protein
MGVSCLSLMYSILGGCILYKVVYCISCCTSILSQLFPVALFCVLYQAAVSYVLNEMFVFCFNCQAAEFCIRWLYPISCIRWLYPISYVRVLNQVSTFLVRRPGPVSGSCILFQTNVSGISCIMWLYPVSCRRWFILFPCIRWCLLSVSCLRLVYPLYSMTVSCTRALYPVSCAVP